MLRLLVASIRFMFNDRPFIYMLSRNREHRFWQDSHCHNGKQMPKLYSYLIRSQKSDAFFHLYCFPSYYSNFKYYVIPNSYHHFPFSSLTMSSFVDDSQFCLSPYCRFVELCIMLLPATRYGEGSILSTLWLFHLKSIRLLKISGGRRLS